MNTPIQHFTKDDLTLHEDVAGARMWAVALDRAMLTYFEVQPDAAFETHTHESEQITFVLEGALVFKTESGTFRVGQGEVIAIPSLVPHSVYTEAEGAKAVDAWSPVMDKYKAAPE